MPSEHDIKNNSRMETILEDMEFTVESLQKEVNTFIRNNKTPKKVLPDAPKKQFVFSLFWGLITIKIN